MANPTLTTGSPFGLSAPLVETWSGFTVTENADHALASVVARRGRLDDLRLRADAHLSVALPPARRCAAGDAIRVLWAGHEQWLVQANRNIVGDLPSLLHDALGDTAAITDQSDAWVNICLEGPRTLAVLEKLCPLDLHPDQFPPRSTARTTFAHLAAIITLQDDGKCFSLLIARSSARSFLNQLRHAANSDQASVTVTKSINIES